MAQEPTQHSADVIIGVFDRRGSAADPPPRRPPTEAEVIRFAPYLLARRGRAVAPPTGA